MLLRDSLWMIACVLVLSSGPAATVNAGGSSEVTAARAQERYGKLPLVFEANQGQTDPAVRFLARASGSTLWLTSTEAVLALGRGRTSRPAVLRMSLRGASVAPQIEGLERLPGSSNYFIGNDPTAWRTHVPQYTRVRYRDVYPGVDLVYYGNQRRLEYDFVLAPGANPRDIRLAFRGLRRIRVEEATGDLLLSLDPGEEVRLCRPVVYQEARSGRARVEARYVVTGRREVGLRIGKYDPAHALVIDPVLVYSTYLGGSGEDAAFGIAVDTAGNAYLTGDTNSVNFPTVNALQSSLGGNRNAFVTKLNAAGSALIYSTYLGGSASDYGDGIAVDPAGNAYMIGYTGSTNFPTVNALQSSLRGDENAFVTKLNAAGSALIYSTYLGGSGFDEGRGIALDTAGNAYVTGSTSSANFPTANALQSSLGGYRNAFVTKLNAAGSALVYSTYLGGNGIDQGWGIAVDSAGNAYVTGNTASPNFPTANALQSSWAGWNDAFVTKLNTAGSALVYSTYLGGSGEDLGYGVAVDTAGNAYVTGTTQSTNFPTANALQSSLGGLENAFVAKLNAAGSTLAYSTYLGGSDRDWGYRIAVDTAGNAYVTGRASSANFPTADAVQPSYGGGFVDAFVTKLNAAGSALVYSTYLGGSGNDNTYGIAVDSAGNAYVTGSTQSADFPTMNPFQAVNAGDWDVFIAKIGPAAQGVFAYAANSNSNDVSAYTIDATTGAPTLVGTVAAGARPRGIAADPAGRFVYVANQNSDSVSAYAIDGATGALTPVLGSPFPTGSLPQGVTVSPTGAFVYVTNCFAHSCFEGSSGSISAYRIDASTGALTPIPGSPFAAGGNAPASIVVDPSARFAYTANRSSNTVSAYAIDATGALAAVASIATGNGPEITTLDPSGRFLYVGTGFDNTIWAYSRDQTTGALSLVSGSPFPAGTHPVGLRVDPSGQFVYAANCGEHSDCNLAGTVSAYTRDPSSGVLTAVAGSPFAAGRGAIGVAMDPTGQFLYVANSNGSEGISETGTMSAYTIDAATGALSAIGTVATGDNPIAVVVTAVR